MGVRLRVLGEATGICLTFGLWASASPYWHAMAVMTMLWLAVRTDPLEDE